MKKKKKFNRKFIIAVTKKKCPMCGEISIKEDLFSAEIKILPPLSENYFIILKLLYKNKENQMILDPKTLSELPNFNRIIRKNSKSIQNIHKKEKEQLEKFLKENLSSQEIENVQFIEEVKFKFCFI